MTACQEKETAQQPNILFVLMDDMGYADLGVYGNDAVHTPNIDQLAAEGMRIEQFYANSPICSPSRAAFITGQFPSRWGITSFIHTREANQKRGMKNFLSKEAPSFARFLQKSGYYTAHIGKWHLGGGRDISEAPYITEYGFNESVTQFEGLGERYLATFETLPGLKDSTRFLEKWSAELGKGEIHWAKRENFPEIFVNRAIEAIKNARHAEKPFYINLWPDAIHTPLEPPKALRGDLSMQARFRGVIQDFDAQIGRLFEYIKQDPELAENTLIIFTSDNGPDPAVNDAGKLRGYKTNIYEGGFREPFIVWWPEMIQRERATSVDRQTVMSAIDVAPTLLEVAGVELEDPSFFDGQSMYRAIAYGETISRDRPLMWLRPPDRPGFDGENAPDLAIRKGEYKLLMDVNQTNIQLYDLSEDEGEKHNIAKELPTKVEALKAELMAWYNDYPHAVDKSVYEADL